MEKLQQGPHLPTQSTSPPHWAERLDGAHGPESDAAQIECHCKETALGQLPTETDPPTC